PPSTGERGFWDRLLVRHSQDPFLTTVSQPAKQRVNFTGAKYGRRQSGAEGSGETRAEGRSGAFGSRAQPVIRKQPRSKDQVLERRRSESGEDLGPIVPPGRTDSEDVSAVGGSTNSAGAGVIVAENRPTQSHLLAANRLDKDARFEFPGRLEGWQI